ncbi:Putative protein [Zobellia galactanivorans]|uniref:Uncharacterized protein n=1 Tax=Zobellia galactanivorans (strain DSM 12802 / CCUG 47099 / CIP 106680 / NCIMB 13871 / Dsij) TaxID=63186 RepID=G0L423_ZOBGA|nr:Putative protein [Zobellia galactanivorans]
MSGQVFPPTLAYGFFGYLVNHIPSLRKKDEKRNANPPEKQNSVLVFH